MTEIKKKRVQDYGVPLSCGERVIVGPSHTFEEWAEIKKQEDAMTTLNADQS
jgi:hypothetical protein